MAGCHGAIGSLPPESGIHTIPLSLELADIGRPISRQSDELLKVRRVLLIRQQRPRPDKGSFPLRAELGAPHLMGHQPRRDFPEPGRVKPGADVAFEQRAEV